MPNEIFHRLSKTLKLTFDEKFKQNYTESNKKMNRISQTSSAEQNPLFPAIFLDTLMTNLLTKWV